MKDCVSKVASPGKDDPDMSKEGSGGIVFQFIQVSGISTDSKAHSASDNNHSALVPKVGGWPGGRTDA